MTAITESAAVVLLCFTGVFYGPAAADLTDSLPRLRLTARAAPENAGVAIRADHVGKPGNVNSARPSSDVPLAEPAWM